MNSDFFIRNRQALRKRAQCELMVIPANGVMQRSGDTTYKFRQDSSFWYLTGVEEPDILLVIDGAIEYLIVPGRHHVREIFDGAIDYSSLTLVSGVKTVLGEQDGWQRLYKALAKSDCVGIMEPLEPYVEFYDFYSNPALAVIKNKLMQKAPKTKIIDLRTKLAELRVIKQPQELANIQKAIDITEDTITDVVLALPELAYEYQVEAAITHGFRSRGAAGHSFDPIVASGKNASMIHYMNNNDKLDKNGLLLLDIGAEVENYAADIARTIIIGKPSSRQRSLLKSVKEVQAYAFSLLKPGQNFYDYEVKIEKRMGRELKKLGLITDSKRASIRKYFPHATSHFIGLDAHDVGDRKQDFKPDMVLAVEPGIIIPEEGIGIRIEDNVKITKIGHKLLSNNLPPVLSSTTM